MHIPVLLEESVQLLDIKNDGFYVDGTFGAGGHSIAILSHLSKLGKLIAFDKDLSACSCADKIIDNRFSIIHGSFIKLLNYLDENSIEGVNGLLLDLGLSTNQILSSRGFSFSTDSPLDMRMDTTCGLSLAQWLNEVDEESLSDVLLQYGQERYHKQIAHNIVHYCTHCKPISSTFELVEIIKKSVKIKDKNKHIATRSFQALRIFINNELDDLKTILDHMKRILCIGGVAVIISFHSLEDTLVKRKFKELSSATYLPKWALAKSNSNSTPDFKLEVKKLRPNTIEIEKNYSSRSAIMRCLRRIK